MEWIFRLNKENTAARCEHRARIFDTVEAEKPSKPIADKPMKNKKNCNRVALLFRVLDVVAPV